MDCCVVCGKPETGKCSACHAAAYCSSDCQQINWSAHSQLCAQLAAEMSIGLKMSLSDIEDMPVALTSRFPKFPNYRVNVVWHTEADAKKRIKIDLKKRTVWIVVVPNDLGALAKAIHTAKLRLREKDKKSRDTGSKRGKKEKKKGEKTKKSKEKKKKIKPYTLAPSPSPVPSSPSEPAPMKVTPAPAPAPGPQVPTLTLFEDVEEDKEALKRLELVPSPDATIMVYDDEGDPIYLKTSEIESSEEEEEEAEPVRRPVDPKNDNDVEEWLMPENSMAGDGSEPAELMDRLQRGFLARYIPEWTKLVTIRRQPSDLADMEKNFLPSFQLYLEKRVPRLVFWAERAEERGGGRAIPAALAQHFKLDSTRYEP